MARPVWRGSPTNKEEKKPPFGKSVMQQTKPFHLPKRLVYDAYKRVKANKGSAGIDGQSLAAFEDDLSGNLYKLWNRLSSGSYMPPPVKRVNIPKAGGGTRPLGIPTVGDRIAQMVVKMEIEPALEKHFHADSYGYRPHTSAHHALQQVKRRCRKRAWVLDMDIKGFFDTIDHGLLMKAVRRHVQEPWQLLYIQRWLQAPVEHRGGRQVQPDRGTPQGGVISPLLANLYLHYAFDQWVGQHCPGIQFARYADDIVCHCRSEAEAKALKETLEARFSACGLALHPDKTKIVYCKGEHYRGHYPAVSFDFLGYTFGPRWVKGRTGRSGLCFVAAVSQKSAKRIRHAINDWPWDFWIQKELKDIRRYAYSRLAGWMHYYGLFGKSIIRNVLFHFDRRLSRWAKRKFKRIKTIMQAARRVIRARKAYAYAFPHWQKSF